MEITFTGKLDSLPTLTKAQLIELWIEHFRTAPPPKIRRELMVSFLAYRLQEREYGGLSHKARKLLEEVAKTSTSKRQKSNESVPTSYLRMWRNEMHEVTSTDDGYEYRGEHFSSLSRIARKITGTSWSGPAFFGIKPRKAK
jgi:hypothetical protein